MSGGPYRVPGKVIPFPGTDTRKWRKEQVPLIWWADIPYCPICGEGGLGRFIRASTQIEGLERANLPDTR